MKDKRQWLQDKLKQYEEQYIHESFELETVYKIKTFIDQNKSCFERSNLYGHITGSAWITDETFDSFLLMHHRKLGIWVQLGGHADGESDILKVALKEAHEESGIQELKILSEDIFDVDIHSFPARLSEPEHFHFDIRFFLQASSLSPLLSENDESFALSWVPYTEIMENTLYENVRRMAEKSRSFNLVRI